MCAVCVCAVRVSMCVHVFMCVCCVLCVCVLCVLCVYVCVCMSVYIWPGTRGAVMLLAASLATGPGQLALAAAQSQD